MRIAVALMALATLACSTTHRSLTTEELDRYPAARAAPLDVQRFIARWTDCARALAQDPMTREDVEEIGLAQHRFCPGIDGRARRLRARYVDRSDILALLGNFERLDH